MKILFSLVLLLSPFTRSNASLIARDDDGGARALRFARLGEEIAFFLKTAPNLSSVPAREFEQAVQLTWVESVEGDLFKGGIPKDAINTHIAGRPGGLIRFRKQAWDLKLGISRLQFVAHEYLGMIDIPDLNYQLSGEIATLMSSRFSAEDAEQLLGFINSLSLVPSASDGKTTTIGPLRLACERIRGFSVTPTGYKCKAQSKEGDPFYETEGPAAAMVYSLLEKFLFPSVCTASICDLTVENLSCRGDIWDLHGAVCFAGSE